MTVLALVAVAVALLHAPRLGPLRPAEVPALLRSAHVATFGWPPSRARLAMASAQVRLEGLALCGRNLGAIGAAPGEPWCRVGGSRLRAWETYEEAAVGWWSLMARRCAGALHAMDGGDAGEVAERLHACGYFRAPIGAYAVGLRAFGR